MSVMEAIRELAKCKPEEVEVDGATVSFVVDGKTVKIYEGFDGVFVRVI